MGHGHHSHTTDEKGLKISIFLNLVITISQVIGGVISGSLALLSDALHNISDVFALIVSFIARRITTKQHSEKQTFGFKRSEIIAAFINAISLVVISVFLIIEALKRIMSPEPVKSWWVIALAIVSIIGNGISVLLLYRSSKSSMNIKSAYLHLFTDMITSFAVLIGGLLMMFFEIYFVDALLSLAIGGYLLYSTYSILVDSLKIIMQFSPQGFDTARVERDITRLPEVKNIHHIHVWQLNENDWQFEAHVDFSEDLPLSHVDKILLEIRNILAEKHNINHVTLQPEYDVDDSKELIVQN